MKLIILTKEFYDDYSNCDEILKRETVHMLVSQSGRKTHSLQFLPASHNTQVCVLYDWRSWNRFY